MNATPLVIDTNIVLDLFVFNDRHTTALEQALIHKPVRWLATRVMRDELESVLAYEHIMKKLKCYQINADQVLKQFDQHVHLQAIAPRTSAICKDPDDQKFIDLAVAHGALLLSKDKAVLCMRKRLLALGVIVQPAMFLEAQRLT